MPKQGFQRPRFSDKDQNTSISFALAMHRLAATYGLCYPCNDQANSETDDMSAAQVRTASTTTQSQVLTDREEHNRVQARLFGANAVQRLTDIPRAVVPVSDPCPCAQLRQ